MITIFNNHSHLHFCNVIFFAIRIRIRQRKIRSVVDQLYSDFNCQFTSRVEVQFNTCPGDKLLEANEGGAAEGRLVGWWPARSCKSTFQRGPPPRTAVMSSPPSFDQVGGKREKKVT